MPRRHAKRTLTTCCTAHTVHDGLSDVTYVLLPLLAQTFGLSLAQVGMIRSAHRVAMAAFQIPAGLFAERFGERNLLALGTAIAGAAFVALGYASGFWMTVKLSVVCIAASVVIGVVGAWIQGSRFRVARTIVYWYIQAFRNTPPLVQLYFFYFGLGALTRGVGGPLVTNVTWAIVSLSFFAGAFNVEIFRSDATDAPLVAIDLVYVHVDAASKAPRRVDDALRGKIRAFERVRPKLKLAP